MANTVSVPGGSSTVSVPPAPAAESTWTVEYELDLTAQTAHDFTSGGDGSTLSMGGVTWTAYNEGASDKFETSAAGLEIDPLGGGQTMWAAVQSLPYLAAKLTDMMTGLSENDTIALQLYMDSSPVPSANYDAYGMALWNGIAPTSSEFLTARYLFSTVKYSDSSVESGTGYDYLAQATAQTFFEIVLFPGNGAAARIGVFDTEFPEPLTTGNFETFASLSGALGPGGGGATATPSWAIPKATASFMITAQRQSSATVLTTTAYKLRVLRRKNS